MRNPHPGNWENLLAASGADGTLLLAFKNPKLKPLTGKSLAEVAKMRGVSAEDELALLVVMNEGSIDAQRLSVEKTPHLREKIGQDIITASGTTLLGAVAVYDTARTLGARKISASLSRRRTEPESCQPKNRQCRNVARSPVM